MIIAFDVDDTLLIPSVATGLSVDTPNYETIAIYKWFQSQGHYMIVWSGSGVDYARKWAEKLGLEPDAVYAKTKFGGQGADIAFDDCDVDLAKVNVKVKRINNNISRKEWNANKTGDGSAD
jgi:hypothetical protein